MTSARDAILGRLRTARATAKLPRTEAPIPVAPLSPPRGTVLQRFQEELAALGVECWVASSPAGVRARVAALLQGRRVFSWNPAELPYGVGDLLVNPVIGGSSRELQAEAEIGLTGCDAAIAETGSLVMLSAAGRSRTVSLLPPVHVAIVAPENLCFSMGEFFAANRQRLAAAASCTFITGPSRTADIELTLTLGIHGPGRVVVVIGPEPA